MTYKLIDYERLLAFSEGLKSKYATKNDIPKKLSSLQEDTNHRLVTDSEKKKWNDKVSQAQITGDMNATGSDKVWNVDFINSQLSLVSAYLDSKIDSSNITHEFMHEADKTKVLSQKGAYDLKEWVNALFQGSYDELIKQTPKKLSQLENDKKFRTESEIQSMIEKASSLKKEVVTSLPTTGKDDVIYLVKDSKGKDNNNYLEYLCLNGKYELIGSTQVDLSGYATKSDLDKKQNVIQFGSGIYKDPYGKICAYQYSDAHIQDTLQKLEAYKLNTSDIQEFTQQELEEAFK